MVDKILKLLLLLSPICYTTNISLQVFDLIFFRLGIMLLFCASLFDKPKRDINLALPIFSILGLCIYNLFIHGFNQIILTYTFNVFLFLLAINIIVNYASNPKEFYKWIKYAAAINIVVFLIQELGYNPIINTSIDTGGIMGNAPRLAAYLSIFAFILFYYSFCFSVVIILI